MSGNKGYMKSDQRFSHFMGVYIYGWLFLLPVRAAPQQAVIKKNSAWCNEWLSRRSVRLQVFCTWRSRFLKLSWLCWWLLGRRMWHNTSMMRMHLGVCFTVKLPNLFKLFNKPICLTAFWHWRIPNYRTATIRYTQVSSFTNFIFLKIGILFLDETQNNVKLTAPSD